MAKSTHNLPPGVVISSPNASTGTATSSPATTPEPTGTSSTFDNLSTSYTSDTLGTSYTSDITGSSVTYPASSTSNTVESLAVLPPTSATAAISSTSPQSFAEQITSSSAAEATTTTSETTTSSSATSSTHINTGAIAGGVIGGVVVVVLLILGLILRRRRKKHIAPSSEFAETIKRGELPVLRLDSGVEIVPSWSHNQVPLPLQQDSYYTSPAMSDMKLLDGMRMGGSDEQSVRYSVEKPLQPLRRSSQQGSNEFTTMGNTAHRVSSIGSSQEFWSRDAGKFDIRKDYRSISPLPTNTNYAPLMQNTYPMEPSHAVDTLQNSYADLWKLSVAPMMRSLPDSVRNGASTQPLPPLRPVRRSVDVGSGRKV
ncbi:uncharacterized protein EDB93DRAFT_1301240 [Suillus bovinus]|uniref:uncharacterized protein n=1 Tax=Suillus bovinus TaxID=48563 RepID=UPI001B87FF58|nr:uncharacterized protein EDB93DRAFT_1301240 [Suillus bovinus]KAG2158138.1 hypothetical protein EDB93DRAFT_1301240 [Suillus bovinus]